MPFRDSLRERGYIEGQNMRISVQSTDSFEANPAVATESVRRNVDVVVTRASPLTIAARRVTSTIPIVMVGVSDPVGPGFAASLARPGGNVTSRAESVGRFRRQHVAGFASSLSKIRHHRTSSRPVGFCATKFGRTDFAAGIGMRCNAWRRNRPEPPMMRALMPTFCRSLEQSLHWALALAHGRHQEYATLEHLLLALIDDPDAAAVMRACNVDIDKLRRTLVTDVESDLENPVTDGSEDSRPTDGFQRVIQRAVIYAHSSGREEVTGVNVLVAIFSERESHAAAFMREQGMTRYDAVNYISHGIRREEPTPRDHASSPRLPIAEQVPANQSGRSTVSFSAALEATLRRALADANAREHEYATLEHLLRALIDDVDASAVMKACQVDLNALKADLVDHIDDELQILATADHRDSRPTLCIQRVANRAVHRVRSLGRGMVTGGDLLLAMLDEKDSPAVWFLGQQGMTHQDATNLCGINKGSGEAPA
jgi:hypothetical protein